MSVLATRRGAVLALLAGAGLTLLAGTQTWVSAPVQGVPGTDEVVATGSGAVPAVTALALVAAAGGVALATAGPRVRPLVAALLVLAGAGVVALAVGVASDPAAAVRPALAAATGTRAARPDGVVLAAWPLVAALGGLLVAAGGALALLRGGSWSGPSRRYDAPSSTGTARTGATGDGATGDGATGDGATPSALAPDAWDALSRGEDPTGRPGP